MHINNQHDDYHTNWLRVKSAVICFATQHNFVHLLVHDLNDLPVRTRQKWLCCQQKSFLTKLKTKGQVKIRHGKWFQCWQNVTAEWWIPLYLSSLSRWHKRFLPAILKHEMIMKVCLAVFNQESCVLYVCTRAIRLLDRISVLSDMLTYHRYELFWLRKRSSTVASVCTD